MPDQPDDHDDRQHDPQPDEQLGGRIRDLLGRAVDEAPPAPELDAGSVMTRPNNSTSARRWLLGGATGISIAAAIVAIFVFARPHDVAAPVIPATEPTVATTTDWTRGTLVAIPTSAPTSTQADEPTSTIPPSSDVTTIATTTEPTTTVQTTAVQTTTVLTTTAATAAPTLVQVVVEAGPAGVTVTGPDGVTPTITEEPMAVAAISRGGRTFMQRSDDQRDPDADTTILMHDPDTGAIAPIQPIDELDGPLRLHDVGEVDGVTTLLVESGPGTCFGFENCEGALWAVRPDDSTATELDRMSVWESGWSRLSVADTGVAVGTISAEAAFGLYSVSLSAEPAVSAASLGLEELYFDCSVCPDAFSIEPSGQYVVWTEFDVTTFQHTLRIVSVDGSVDRSVSLIDSDGSPCCGNDFGAVFPILPSLSVSDLSTDGEPTQELIAVNEAAVDGLPPVSIDIATGVATEGRLGVTTTFGTLEVTDTDG